MKLLLCLFLVVAVVSLPVFDYDGGPVEGDAWITLTVHGDPTQLLNLQHVTWCKSFVPNDQSPPELSPDCSGRNSMRLLLFPGNEEVVLKERPESGSSSDSTIPAAPSERPRFYIDPARVGGWDTRHQWNIYLEMSQRNGVTWRESIRFNALVPITASEPVSSSTATTTTATIAAAGSTGVVATSEPGVITGSGTVIVRHSWKGAILVLSTGTFFVMGLVVAAKFLQAQRAAPPPAPSVANQRGQMQLRVYGGNGNAYSFENQQAIEMTDFSSEDERLRREDLQILEMLN